MPMPHMHLLHDGGQQHKQLLQVNAVEQRQQCQLKPQPRSMLAAVVQTCEQQAGQVVW